MKIELLFKYQPFSFILLSPKFTTHWAFLITMNSNCNNAWILSFYENLEVFSHLVAALSKTDEP
jgi:hypothetical protein